MDFNIFSPIYIQKSTSNVSIANVNSNNQNLLQEDPNTPVSTPNPYNSRSDGFLTRAVYGGITGKNTGKSVFDATPNGIKPESGFAQAMLKQTGINMGVSAAIYGGLSILKQGTGLAMGKQDVAGAFANLTADVLNGGAAGLGATLGSGMMGFAMRALGSTGTIGTIVTVIGGMAGATFASSAIESTGLRGTLVNAFGSKKAMV